jgi:hypothetical protein
MEQLLQVVDEFDDAVGAVRHWWLGAGREFAVMLGSIASAAFLAVALLLGAGPILIATAAIALSAAVALSMRRRFEMYATQI